MPSRRLQETEALNEAMQRALKNKLSMEDPPLPSPTPLIIAQPKILCHTPHLLGPPDRTAPMRRAKEVWLSGYPQSSHF